MVDSYVWYALTSLTINRNLRLNLTISGAKFKKIKQGKFTKRSNKFELLENADIMCGGIACGYRQRSWL